MQKIKLCGMMKPCDIEYANRVKPDFVGFIFANTRRKISAARAAKLCGKAALGAHELGLYAYLFPMSENPFVCDRCRRVLSAIREYDAQNHTNLEQTALVYVKENMEIAAAAKALFQHPNTVRYRLSKIQRIMGMEDDPLFAPMLSLTVSLSRILTEEQA